jgi:hypothetical protein
MKTANCQTRNHKNLFQPVKRLGSVKPIKSLKLLEPKSPKTCQPTKLSQATKAVNLKTLYKTETVSMSD